MKALKGVDVREVGSGSTGATNVMRAAGKWVGAFVLFMDAFKGFVPVWLAIALAGHESLSTLPWASLHVVPPVVDVSPMIGHTKSLFLKFQGGKSAATGLGTLIALDPAVGCLTFALWILMVAATRLVSLASIVAVWSCGAIMFAFHNPASYVGYCLFGALYVTYRHKPNIKRLLTGTEARLGEKPKGDAEADEAAEAAGTSLESSH